ncbi:MAG: response regulator, partial [Leptospiraceae bacterium]|nr:response regulator [Leptospiraceae bacterium]
MPSQRQLVLFEKNGDDRKQAEQALRNLPYTIISAAEQEQILALCRNQQCEVILIGLPLPEGQSLVDLLQQLRELPQPPIAVVLANPSATPEILAALRSGVLDCILKPVAQAEAELVLNRAFALAKTEKLTQIAMEERGDFYRRRLEQQEILTELVRQQNETMERALFENLRTAFVQGHGIG